MAIKPITEFEGDSWKKQEPESDRAHHYFEEFKLTKLGRDKFIELLMKEADERSAEGQVKFWTSDKTFNKKNQKQIQLYVDTKGKKGQCPKPCGTLKDWFDNHKWSLRRKDYWKFLNEDADAIIQAMVTEVKVGLAKGVIQCMKNTIENRKQQYEEGRLSLSQDESGSKSINNDANTLDMLSNNDTQKVEATVNAGINADVDVNVKPNLSEDMILNPKYAELTKQLREDVLNGRTDSSKDTR